MNAAKKRFLTIAGLGFMVKILLAALTAWSYEFIFLVKAASIRFEADKLNAAPWIKLGNMLYKLWLILPIEHPSLDKWLIRLEVFPESFEGFLLVFILKLPILIMDVLCAFLIYKIAEALNKDKASTALMAWMLNPYVVLTAEMIGSNDLMLVFLVLLSVWLVLKGKSFLSCFPLMAGVAFKLYPILAAPVLAVYMFKKDLKKNLMFLALSVVIGVFLYNFWLKKAGLNFEFTLLNYNPLTFQASEMFFSQYTARVGLSVASATVYALLIFDYWQNDKTEALITKGLLGFLLAYFAFFNWWPQYLLILTAFLALDYAENKKYFYAVLTSAFLMELVYFEFATEQSFFFIYNYVEWMRKASSALIKFKSNIASEVVLGPLLRSLYAVLSLIYASKIFFNFASLKLKKLSLN
ncbi:MAG: hypothetical protein QXZ53_06620 [Candidatus Bathyarchaeia archaeon]